MGKRGENIPPVSYLFLAFHGSKSSLWTSTPLTSTWLPLVAPRETSGQWAGVAAHAWVHYNRDNAPKLFSGQVRTQSKWHACICRGDQWIPCTSVQLCENIWVENEWSPVISVVLLDNSQLLKATDHLVCGIEPRGPDIKWRMFLLMLVAHCHHTPSNKNSTQHPVLTHPAIIHFSTHPPKSWPHSIFFLLHPHKHQSLLFGLTLDHDSPLEQIRKHL